MLSTKFDRKIYPFGRVKDPGVDDKELTVKLTFANGAFADRGVYPYFLACETTEFRSKAESKKDSFASMFI